MATQRQYTAEEAQTRFNLLPPSAQEFLYSKEMFDTLKQIGDKNHLHIDQMSMLEGQTNAAMLGFIEPQDFVAILSDELRIDHVQAEAIAKDINDLLVTKIREGMKNAPQVQKAPAPLPVAVRVPPQPAPAPKPLESHPADMMLSQKTVSSAPLIPGPLPTPPQLPQKTDASTAPITPVQPSAPKTNPAEPQPYKADPYREPIQ